MEVELGCPKVRGRAEIGFASAYQVTRGETGIGSRQNPARQLVPFCEPALLVTFLDQSCGSYHFAQIRAPVVHEAKIANKLKCKGSIVWKCNLHCFLRCVSLGQDLPQLGSSGFPYDSAVARGRRVRSAAGAASSAKKVMHRTGHPSPRNRYTWCHGRHEADKRCYGGPHAENMETLRGFDS